MAMDGRRRAGRDEEVEIRFLEALRKRRPVDRRVLEALGDLYTRTGRFQEGLDVDLELARRHPADPLICYNLACSLALVGKKGEALDTLERAVAQGYADGQWMLEDEDLASLRSDPRFKALVRRVLSGKATPRKGVGKGGGP